MLPPRNPYAAMTKNANFLCQNHPYKTTLAYIYHENAFFAFLCDNYLPVSNNSATLSLGSRLNYLAKLYRS